MGTLKISSWFSDMAFIFWTCFSDCRRILQQELAELHQKITSWSGTLSFLGKHHWATCNNRQWGLPAYRHCARHGSPLTHSSCLERLLLTVVSQWLTVFLSYICQWLSLIVCYGCQKKATQLKSYYALLVWLVWYLLKRWCYLNWFWSIAI